jgi:hypothetical protein
MSYRLPLKIWNAINAEATTLADDADNAVRLSFRTADHDCREKPGEVDKVLSFFIQGLDVIERQFNRRLNPHKVRVTISGIFTHQTPKVTQITSRCAGQTCELADLCILVTYGTKLERGGLGTATLLQAKNNFFEGADEVQRSLYEEESQFRYKSPADLASKSPNTRTFPPKWEPALGYWQLGEWYWHRFPYDHTTAILWANRMTRHTVGAHTFGDAVVDILRGSAGYGFREPKSGETGWSRMLFDLIEVTAKQTVRRKNLLNTRTVQTLTYVFCHNL